MIDELQAIEVVKKAIAARGGEPNGWSFRARRDGDGWSIFADRIWGYSADGAPLHVRGGHCRYVLDEGGNIASRHPGR
jgi:hypothetical protein